MVNNAYQQYQNNAVMTASQGELTLMLYNGAIKFCNIAEDAIIKKDYNLANTNIIKAQKIIQELRYGLDMTYPVSQDMGRLYDFINQTLIEANMSKDIEKLDISRDFIREFRDTWKLLLNK